MLYHEFKNFTCLRVQVLSGMRLLYVVMMLHPVTYYQRNDQVYITQKIRPDNSTLDIGHGTKSACLEQPDQYSYIDKY